MSLNRAQAIDDAFVALLKGWSDAPSRRLSADEPVAPDNPMTGKDLLQLFESQMVTRHLDLIARYLRSKDAAYYTIGSAGHEGNAMVGRLTRLTDPAFLHYRSGGFMAERCRKVPEIDFIYDTILSQAASAEDPISGGRHKVWGSVPAWVLPQTSTIASHLPKAVGAAIGLQRARALRIKPPVPDDSIIVCSFGDASTNHSTAQGAFNAAQWAAFQSLPVPVLFVCEDNGIGISVRTPPGWIETNFSNRPGLAYFRANGLDLVEGYSVVAQAVEHCRRHRAPTFLHLRTIRMLGHAGSDIELAYHTLEEIAEVETHDPLLTSARRVLEFGLMTAPRILEMYEAIRSRTREAAERVIKRPRLASAAEVMAPLAPYHPEKVNAEARRGADAAKRADVFGGVDKLPEKLGRRHLAVQINAALFDLMALYSEMIVFGEDVAQKGGVYYVTKDLFKRYKAGRVFNTLLDEQTILGLAQGAGYMGLLPFPEIQYLAYFHNACDQIRGEACSMQFFSKGQYRNPMVMRVASLAYQKGFGGHFHNDNSIAALRDIPGLVIACPSRGDDAAAMIRTCAALARVDGRVVAFLEPIALYMTKDLHETGDEGWSFDYPPPGEAIPLGEPRVYFPDADDLCILTFGNGVYMSLRAAKVLERDHGIRARVVDLRWLLPLNEAEICEQASACGNVLIVDEGRRSAGVSEGIITAIVEGCPDQRTARANAPGAQRAAGFSPRGPSISSECSTGRFGDLAICRIVGEDTYIPLGPAANLVLPQEEQIISAAVEMCAGAAAKPPRKPARA
ncbi:MAG: MFS transporter [Phycisphaerae bacterium]|nr:MAG: MFS transporter [Planctomycetia bacterium]RIK69757.1 MAG: MFS transporter [Planctomycetota bacterium]GJQ26139.1 MAG: MFS transporter [Phycisphaerae bacterium]